MKKYALLAIFIIGVASLGIFLVLSNGGSESQTQDSTTTNEVATNPDQSADFPSETGPKLLIGNGDAPVVIQEFIDYKCPNCNTFHRTVKKELEQKYADSIVFEIHQTPFIGPDSGRAARGAYCSQIHGDVFAGYNDLVFGYMYDNYYSEGNFASEFEDILTEDVLSNLYTTAGGTSETEFRDCLNDTATINLYINADQLLAAENGLRGTPSFVIGDSSLIGPQQLSVFTALIEAEL